MGGRLTEDLLRRWVLGRLPPQERREVTRWVVTCTDPNLGPLLDGMLRESEEARADAALASLGRAWAELVDRWRSMLELGAAGWSGVQSPILADAGVLAPAVHVTPVGHRVLVEGRDSVVEVAVYLTDDTGRCERLVAPGPWRAPGFQDFGVTVGARPTVWAFTAAALPRAPDPVEELNAALRTPGAVANAVRWDPTEG